MHHLLASAYLVVLTHLISVLANGRQPIFVNEVGVRTPLSSFVGDESPAAGSSRAFIQSTEEEEKRYFLNIRPNGRKAGPEFTADVERLCAAIEGCTHALSEWGIISSNKPLSHLAQKIIADSKLFSVVEKVVPVRKIFLNATLFDPKKSDLKSFGAGGGAKSKKAATAGWSSSPTRDSNNYFWHTDRIDSYSLGYDNASYSLSKGKGVHIYVLDTGINPRDPRLFASFDPGAKSRLVEALTTLVSPPYIDSDKTVINVDLGGGHGTHVMGLAGGLQTSVASEASLHAIKVFGMADGAYDDDIYAGMYYAYENIPKGARGIVSMSLGGPGRSSLAVMAVEALRSKGIVTVLAAGNSDTNACGFSPAFAHNAVTVGASDISDNAADFSNFGPCVDIWAPGVDDKSIFFQVENSTELMSGTSMATPVTAGAVATLLAAAPDITVPSVGRLLQISGSPSIHASVDMMYYNDAAPSTNKLVFTRPLQFQPIKVSAPLVRVPGSGPATTTFMVSLKQKFDSNVVIQLSPSDSDRATVKPKTLTFTPNKWKKTQTVTITMKSPTNNNGKFVPGPASKVGDSFFIDLVATSSSFDLNPPYAYYVVEVADDRTKEYGSSVENAIPVTSIPYQFSGDLRSYPPATAHWHCTQDTFLSKYPAYLYDIRDMIYEDNVAIFKFEPSKFDYCKNKPTCGLQLSTCKSASIVRLNLVEESKVTTLGTGASKLYSLEGLCTGEPMLSPGEPCAFYQGGYGDQRMVFFMDPTKTYYVFVQASEAPVNGPFTLEIMPSFPQELLPLTVPSASNNPAKCSQALYNPDWSYYGKDLSLSDEGDVVTLYTNGYDPNKPCLWTVSTKPGLTLDFEVLFLDTQSGYCNRTGESCSDVLAVYPEKDLITGAITTKAQSFEGYGAGTQISDLGTTALVYFEPNALVQLGGFMVQVKAVAQPNIPVATTYHCMPGLNTSFAVSVADGQAQTIAALSLQPNLRCTYNVTVPPGKGLVISTIAAELGLESGIHFALVKDAAGNTYSLDQGFATLPNGAGPFTIILTTGPYIYSAQGAAFSLMAEDTYTAPPPAPVSISSPYACPPVPAPTASILVLNCTNATQGALSTALAAGKSVRLIMVGDATDTCVFNVSTAATATLSVTTECLGISEVTDVIRIHSDSGFQAAVTGSADGRVFSSLGSVVRLAYQKNPFDTNAQIPAAFKRGGFTILVSSVLRSGAPAATRGDPLPTCPTPKGRPSKSVFLCSGVTDQLINGRRPRTPDVGYLTLLADSYDPGVSCTWRVRAPVGSSISINVTCMDTEPFFDYLTITNGVSTFRYSGYNKTQHPFLGDDITITFKALPGSIPRSGFELSYEFVEGSSVLVRDPFPEDIRRDVCPPPAANEPNLLLCNPFNDGAVKTVYPQVGESGAFYLKDPRYYVECVLYVVAPPGYEAVFDIDCLDLYDGGDGLMVGSENAAGGGYWAYFGPLTNVTVPAGPTGRFLYYSWNDQQKTSGFLIHYRVQPIASPPVRPSQCDTAIAAAAPATLTCDRMHQDLELLTIGAGTGHLVLNSYVSFQRCAAKLRANAGLVFKTLKFTCVDLEYDRESGTPIEEIQVTSGAGTFFVSSADSGSTVSEIHGVGHGRNVEILFQADESVELSGFVITWTVGTA